MLDLGWRRIDCTKKAQFIILSEEMVMAYCDLGKVVKHGCSKYRLMTFSLPNAAAAHHSSASILAVGIVPQVSP
jgi:hypothetical protein